VLSVGHQPSHALAPQDAALFRAFQSNLLSLISHELRTPLTGILNSLNLLQSGEAMGEFTEKDLITMARQNAQRLHRTLVMLLDLASLESGTYHARLREIDLARIARSRVDAFESLFKDHGLATEIRLQEVGSPLLGDPQKIGRALDLCFQALMPRSQGDLQIRISSSELELHFTLKRGMEEAWDSAWSQSIVGFHGGVASPISLFAGVLQSEQAFLTRMEEGLGSELILIHEIMRIHQGRADAERSGSSARLKLEFPTLSSEDGLRAVLTSRAYEVSTELSSVALALVKVPQGAKPEEFSARIRKSLFRTSDAVYALADRGEIALVLDDCHPEAAPGLLNRLQSNLGVKLKFGISHCPADGLDPAKLLELAERRLAST
jgi:hypothetical protein